MTEKLKSKIQKEREENVCWRVSKELFENISIHLDYEYRGIDSWRYTSIQIQVYFWRCLERACLVSCNISRIINVLCVARRDWLMTLGTAEGSILNGKRMCEKWRGNHAAYHLAAQNFHRVARTFRRRLPGKKYRARFEWEKSVYFQISRKRERRRDYIERRLPSENKFLPLFRENSVFLTHQ